MASPPSAATPAVATAERPPPRARGAKKTASPGKARNPSAGAGRSQSATTTTKRKARHAAKKKMLLSIMQNDSAAANTAQKAWRRSPV